MKSESAKTHPSKLNRDITNSNKLLHIYYAHSFQYYDSQTERNDLKFLKSKHAKVINPNGLALGKDMIQYLFKVKDCDAVWYRGNTIGVVFEVLTALAMHKPVYSLETKDVISPINIKYFAGIFRNNRYIDNDLFSFEFYFPDYYPDFIGVISGEMS